MKLSNVLWLAFRARVATGDYIPDEELAALLRRSEGLPRDVREYFADRIEGRHRRPARKPPKTHRQRNERAAHVLTLGLAVAEAHARHVKAKVRSPLTRARADVARGENPLGIVMDAESLRQMLKNELPELARRYPRLVAALSGADTPLLTAPAQAERT